MSLPDISKWNTENVIDMGGMFSIYSSLVALPDISKWNVINIIYMSEFFSYCSYLSSLPDISNWKTNSLITIYLLDYVPLFLKNI